MINEKDNLQIAEKGIKFSTIQAQLSRFSEGFPYLEITSSASIEKGIKLLSEECLAKYITVWNNYLSKGKEIVKFVPASGAASRMFKDLFSFLDATYDEPTTSFEKKFFEEIKSFAFCDALNSVCLTNANKTIDELIQSKEYKEIVRNLLDEKGLAYGKLPKGLLQFHNNNGNIRTAMEEHLAEGAMYAKSDTGNVGIHFTVSPEHLPLFTKLVEDVKKDYEEKFSVTFSITFSQQKQNTDTIAANIDNTPFRDGNGNLMFRPAGHGALIENLCELEADIAFIKNIDNVVPDTYKPSTITYKKALAGLLVDLQAKIFEYLDVIESGKYNQEKVEEMIQFLQKDLCVKNPAMKNLEDAELILYLKSKFNRPLRVCGMVQNVGEPGGGPFLSKNADGTISLQILESSQIDMNNIVSKSFFEKGTHFNPVDLVCALRDNNGQKFNLSNCVDADTGFISEKSKDGKVLKALELPGLWNGAMSDWNTIFVEVPIETFNPVKTVNDLLRAEHQ